MWHPRDLKRAGIFKDHTVVFNMHRFLAQSHWVKFNFPLNYKLIINRRGSKRLQWKPQECAGQPLDVGRSQGGEAEPPTVTGKECFTVCSLHRPMCFVSVYCTKQWSRQAILKYVSVAMSFLSFFQISQEQVSLWTNDCCGRMPTAAEKSEQLQYIWRYCSPCNILKCTTKSALSGVATFELGSWLLTIYHNSFGVSEVESGNLVSKSHS